MSAREMPGDRGLPALGLMMQLMAGIDALLQMLLAIVMLRLPGALTLGSVAVLALGIARAFAHYVAGVEIRAGGMRILGRVRALLVLSVSSFAVVTWLGSGPLTDRLLLAADVLWWPLLLVVVLHSPGWRERLRKVSEGELQLVDSNRGIEAAGALMVALAIIGVVIDGAVIWALLDASRVLPMLPAEGAGLGSWILLAAVALLLRSLFHLSVGVRAMRGASPSRVHRLIGQYTKVCWATLVVTVLPLLYGIVEQVDFMGTLAIAVVTMLSLWPVILRGFAEQVGGEFGQLDDQGFAPAPDAGLVATGWLLAAVVAGSAVPAVVALLDGSAEGAALDEVGWFLDPALPVWTGIAGVAVAAWASVEALRLTARARVAVSLAALVTIALTVWAHGDAFGSMGDGLLRSLARVESVLAQADLLAALVVPVMMLVLALRSWQRRSS